MNTQRIMEMQRMVNDLSGSKLVVDGVWGEKSEMACRQFLRGLMPKPHPFPRSDAGSMVKFYGNPGDESRLVAIDAPGRMYFGDTRVRKIRVHEKCAESLSRVLVAIVEQYGDDEVVAGVLADFGGVYNYRVKRSGSGLSMHAWGAAIDLGVKVNGMKKPWPEGANMPLEVVMEFAKEGWLSAGAMWGYDAMHFQATQ